MEQLEALKASQDEGGPYQSTSKPQAGSLEIVLERKARGKKYVYMYHRRGGGIVLQATPTLSTSQKDSCQIFLKSSWANQTRDGVLIYLA